MKHLILITSFFVIFFTATAQVKKSAYKSTYLVEMGWNSTKTKLITLKTVYNPSYFLLTEKKIYFKKAGNTKWLQNEWVFDKTEETKNGTMDTYFDERQQKIIIYYDNSEIWYFHDWDKSLQKYLKLTVYKECREDEELAEKLGINVDAEGDYSEEEEDDDDEDGVGGKFRVDMKYISIYDVNTKKWSEWKDGYNTFIINANENKDIIHIKNSGKEVVYRRTSQKVERKRTDSGKGYQIIYAIDENGNRFQFQMFDDIEIGIKMIYNDVMIQFANIK